MFYGQRYLYERATPCDLFQPGRATHNAIGTVCLNSWLPADLVQFTQLSITCPHTHTHTCIRCCSVLPPLHTSHPLHHTLQPPSRLQTTDTKLFYATSSGSARDTFLLQNRPYKTVHATGKTLRTSEPTPNNPSHPLSRRPRRCPH